MIYITWNCIIFICSDYKEVCGEKQLKIETKKQKTAPRLRRAEALAIALTIVFLALSIGYHIGLGRRAADFSVETARERPPAVVVEIAGQAPVDINTAGAEELKLLRGVGDVLAERIIAYREENGPFRRVDDITLVRGIGSAVLENNRERLTVSGLSADGEEEAA